MPTDAGQHALAHRTIGRSDRQIPPVLWTIDSASDPSPDVLRRCADVGATWFLIPLNSSNEQVERCAPLLAGGSIVLGMEAAQFSLRSTKSLDDRLAALGRSRCDAVLLQDVSLAEVKEGRTFHRYAQLRDAGRVGLCFVDAATPADAEWMVLHTPAQGVAMRYGIADQTARYRTLGEAAEIATAIFARRPDKAVWDIVAEKAPTRTDDIAFALGHPAVTAVIELLPADVAGVDLVIRAARTPLSATVVDAWWREFSKSVPEPPKLRGGHPPEWA